MNIFFLSKQQNTYSHHVVYQNKINEYKKKRAATNAKKVKPQLQLQQCHIVVKIALWTLNNENEYKI